MCLLYYLFDILSDLWPWGWFFESEISFHFPLFNILATVILMLPNFLIWFSTCRGSGNAIQIMQRHHFASHLKRMAVVVRVQEQFFSFVKVWIYITNTNFRSLYNIKKDRNVLFVRINGAGKIQESEMVHASLVRLSHICFEHFFLNNIMKCFLDFALVLHAKLDLHL